MDRISTVFLKAKEESQKNLLLEKKRMSAGLLAVISLFPILMGFSEQIFYFTPLSLTFAMVYYLLYKAARPYQKTEVSNPFPVGVYN